MEIKKAIEILQARINCQEEGNPRDIYDATKLGIKALEEKLEREEESE